MKKIVNGKRYDTETADLIASWGNGYYSSDFKHCEEELYRTKKGNFFLFGEGGPMSKYAVGNGNGYSGGSDLAPMTPDEARQWLEDTGNFSELETLFADSVEDA
jgi:hypothetical protein